MPPSALAPSVAALLPPLTLQPAVTPLTAPLLPPAQLHAPTPLQCEAIRPHDTSSTPTSGVQRLSDCRVFERLQGVAPLAGAPSIPLDTPGATPEAVGVGLGLTPHGGVGPLHAAQVAASAPTLVARSPSGGSVWQPQAPALLRVAPGSSRRVPSGSCACPSPLQGTCREDIGVAAGRLVARAGESKTLVHTRIAETVEWDAALAAEVEVQEVAGEKDEPMEAEETRAAAEEARAAAEEARAAAEEARAAAGTSADESDGEEFVDAEDAADEQPHGSLVGGSVGGSDEGGTDGSSLAPSRESDLGRAPDGLPESTLHAAAAALPTPALHGDSPEDELHDVPL